MGISKRRTGAEFRAMMWMARHPGMSTAPAFLGAGVLELGPVTVGSALAGTAAAGLGWYRAHPDSYDSYAGPVLRAFRRRWLRYVGTRWRDIMESCGLSKTKRNTDHVLTPRLMRVRSAAPSIDTLYVRLLRGQSVKQFQDRHGELAAAFKADTLGITPVKPQVVAITVVRGNPFADVIEATDIPAEASDVDFSAIELGEDEYGNTWTEPLAGNHWLGAGAMGSGKSSLIWNALRALGPAIRDRLVVVDMCDLKGGMETSQGRPLFDHYATDPAHALEVIEAFRDELKDREALLAEQGARTFTPSVQTPLRVLMIDELAMMTALGDASITRTATKVLAEILTQGRAAGFSVCVYVQEPTKDIVPIRDLFTRRMCLRALTALHPDMVLGDDARVRGAIADEIPADPEHAGIGFRVDDRTRRPTRVRAGYVPDNGITELVATCTPDRAESNVIALPETRDPGDDTQDDDTTTENGDLDDFEDEIEVIDADDTDDDQEDIA
ncbi:cell division protein FtsK [Allosaccharopolyspora coralli]|uniref:cell division protein FtsK n=1 Tax=Allosaccharopolyspora coralli TaxID=2665642 RepID=UPI001651FF18|nr:cell division protein FtsK [Allosaccharopolyspora coralli]